MSIPPQAILTLNGGSSSIRFAMFDADSLERIVAGKLDRIGQDEANLMVDGSDSVPLPSGTRPSDFVFDWLERQSAFEAVAAAGHRVVHGMNRPLPKLLTAGLLDDLRALAPYDQDHMPREIELIETASRRYPKLPQVACFDTSFHRTMPRVAKLLPIPRRYDSMGVQRYGFHGLSYAYLMEELTRLGDPAATNGAVVLAHLGGGASLAAVRNGKSIDTTMGFTPAAGLLMGTRPGDLDPGLGYYLAHTEGMSAAAFNKVVNHECGLLGVSETSSDMRDLLQRETSDVRAAEAVELFCYAAKKWIGAFAAALGGLDTLVFAGGIGENSPAIRRRICDGLAFLGVELDQARNIENSALISSGAARVRVRVIPTNEELMIARSVARLLNIGSGASKSLLSSGEN